jgi:thioredoxin reductase
VIDLLVIGAGPYGLSAAREARRRGLSVCVVGRPMSFWREHMPAGMYLRSGPDWHLDPAEELTLREFAPDLPDPIPVARFLAYADWFAAQAGIEVCEEEVVRVEAAGGVDAGERTAGGVEAGERTAGVAARSRGAPEPRGFVATLASGGTVSARAVVAAPGISRFGVIPDWGAGLGEHTCDLVDFTGMEGARVLIVGGRQSAYEWAALIGEHGAERVDVVHRHAEPRFDRVSWAFVEPHIEATLSTPGWWRSLAPAERDAIGRRFWEVGRLTLEHWLAPRLARLPVHRHANADVVAVTGADAADARPGRDAAPACRRDAARHLDVTLSTGIKLQVDRIVFACGYRSDIARVPYLPDISTSDGFPDLDAAFGTSVPGLYIPGFPATRDFGPFFGFVRGAVPAARMIVRDMMRA